MDRAITASKANQHFSRMLREVGEGQSFVVMSRGRPVARVAPVTEARQAQPVAELLSHLRSLPRRSGGAWTRDDLYS